MPATRLIGIIAIALAAVAPAHAGDSASERLERLAAEAYERTLDLFPFFETMGIGAGPRQDRVELTFTPIIGTAREHITAGSCSNSKRYRSRVSGPSERLTHRLLAHHAQQGLEWLSVPFHQHYVFIQLDGGVATNLVKLTAAAFESVLAERS